MRAFRPASTVVLMVVAAMAGSARTGATGVSDEPTGTCQCKRQREICESSITQEDLLCDACRSSCTAVRGIFDGPTRHLRLDATGIRVTLR